MQSLAEQQQDGTAASFSVRLQQVRKVFGQQPVLCGVTTELRPGQLALLMGPNGAGKSTLLALLSTLSRPTSGQVYYGLLDHGQAEQRLRQRIGFLGHSPMLYQHLSGAENLTFFARLYGLRQVQQAVSRWLSRVGMETQAQKAVGQLSRGMVQRLALARALIAEPALLLLDEPFTGLDRDGVALLRQELQAASERGCVVALVSHDIEAVDGLCDHLLLLRRGRLVDELRGPQLTAALILERYHACL